jgi:serine/threonine protein kinase
MVACGRPTSDDDLLRDSRDKEEADVNAPPAKLGKYELIEEIGRGGFAVVYKALDPDLERWVALKVLAPHLCWEPTFVEQFRREAKAVAKLNHPHIVQIYEIGEARGQLYLVMEYLPGRTLEQLLKAETALSAADRLAILRQVAAALDYAHAQQLLHRDLKPGNIMVAGLADPPLKATLMDFGMVKAVAHSQYVRSTQSVAGTPEYMSPEQADAKPLDARSDLYAFGVVAYELFTGRVPFSSESPLAVLRGHVDRSPPDPQRLRSELPAAVAAVLLKALSKAPEDRFQRAAALVSALEAALDQAEQSGRTGAPAVERTEAPPVSRPDSEISLSEVKAYLEAINAPYERPRLLVEGVNTSTRERFKYTYFSSMSTEKLALSPGERCFYVLEAWGWSGDNGSEDVSVSVTDVIAFPKSALWAALRAAQDGGASYEVQGERLRKDGFLEDVGGWDYKETHLPDVSLEILVTRHPPSFSLEHESEIEENLHPYRHNVDWEVRYF